MTVCITLPIRVVSEANAHEHWRVRAKRAKSQKDVTTLMLRATVAKSMLVMAPITVTLTRIIGPKGQAFDPGDNLNMSAKHVRDAIAAYLEVNDRSEEVVRYEYAQRRGEAYGVEVRIELRDAARESA